VDETKVLAKEFLEIDFSHVMRQSNSAIHNNARHARCVSELTVWMKYVSSHLLTVIQAVSTISQIKLQCSFQKKKKEKK